MKKSKHGLFVFPPKKTLIWRRHPSIGQWCCSMTSKRSIDWFLESSRALEVFSPERSLNQSKATSVCICSTNQSYCSISVFLLFLFCSRVFISRDTKIALFSWTQLTKFGTSSARAHLKKLKVMNTNWLFSKTQFASIRLTLIVSLKYFFPKTMDCYILQTIMLLFR